MERRYGTVKYLIDHREMIPDLSTVDLYYLAAELSEMREARRLIVAVIWTPTPQMRQVIDFYSIRTKNIGLNRKFFTDEESALTWLAQAQ